MREKIYNLRYLTSEWVQNVAGRFELCIPLNISMNVESWCLIPANTWLCGWRIKGLFVEAKRARYALSLLNSDAAMAVPGLGWGQCGAGLGRRWGQEYVLAGKSWPRAGITDWGGRCYSRHCLGVWNQADLIEIPVPPLEGCVALGKSLHLLCPLFSQRKVLFYLPICFDCPMRSHAVG